MAKKENEKKSNGPAMEIFGVTRHGEKDWWTKIGAAWQNKDGSMNLNFDFLPTDPSATIQLRPLKED